MCIRDSGYSVVFHKYRTNVAAEDITEDVIKDVKKISIRKEVQ